MTALSTTELAALYPLVKRIGPVAIVTSTVVAFALSGLVVLALGGTLALAAIILVAEAAGAGLFFGEVCILCALEEKAERAHREVSAASHTAGHRCSSEQ